MTTSCKELIRQLAVKELEALEKERGTKFLPGSMSRLIWYRLIGRYHHNDKKTFPFKFDDRLYKILSDDDDQVDKFLGLARRGGPRN